MEKKDHDAYRRTSEASVYALRTHETRALVLYKDKHTKSWRNWKIVLLEQSESESIYQIIESGSRTYICLKNHLWLEKMY